MALRAGRGTTFIGYTRDLRSRVLAAVATGAFVLVAASSCFFGEGDLDARAQSMVRAYLTQLASEEGDRGWTLLHPATQREMFNNDKTTYLDLAAAGDWDAFRWSIDHVLKDDDQLYRVFLSLPAGSEPPPLLTTVRNHLVLMGQSRAITEIPVRFGADGEGIWAIGG